tara:strand:+ start:271 stop:510 length:240 start_codon:yes stop_codon:yes gene_type:complete
MWIVYIIRCNDNSLYIGITNNLKKRIENHERGTGAKYTRGRGPFEVIYKENYSNRSRASQREYALKKLTLEQKLNLIKK